MNYSKVRRIAILLSILFHLLLLLLFQQAGKLEFLLAKPSEPEEIPEERLVFELVETPDDAPEDEPSSATDLVSDKNTRARDMMEEDLARSELPFSEGDLDIKEFAQPENPIQPEQPAPPIEPIIPEKSEQENPGSDESTVPDQTEEDQVSEPADQIKEQIRKSLSYENLNSNSVDKGGISFNTYNWNFAPYMLAMKKRIESNWRPPFAFTHMGAISGTNQYRFRVTPDGRVVNLQQLDSNAHYSLDQASSGAISSSSPFMPLPINFPEDYLEVTITFSYIIKK